jgi:hypothetical protein
MSPGVDLLDASGSSASSNALLRSVKFGLCAEQPYSREASRLNSRCRGINDVQKMEWSLSALRQVVAQLESPTVRYDGPARGSGCRVCARFRTS